MENGIVKKDDGIGIYVNFLFNGGNGNKFLGFFVSLILGNLIGSEVVFSFLFILCWSCILSEFRIGILWCGRVNSIGNVFCSYEW